MPNVETTIVFPACIHIAGVDGIRALLVKARNEIVNAGNTACRQNGLVGTRECDCALCDLQAAIEHIDALGRGDLRRLSRAAGDVLDERNRQIEAEGWTPQHDDQHAAGELSQAAADYAANASFALSHGKHLLGSTVTKGAPPLSWPWARKWWKPKTVRRDLVRAAALILAEIERLDRRDAAHADGLGTD